MSYLKVSNFTKTINKKAHQGFGHRPTVSMGNARTIETNIFGFDEDIYGLDMDVTFMSKIRDEIRFDSLDGLKHQLECDRDACLSKL